MIDDGVFGPEVPLAAIHDDDDDDPLLPVSRSPAKRLGILALVAVVAIIAVGASMLGGEPTAAEHMAQAASVAAPPSTQPAAPAVTAAAAEPAAADTQGAEPPEPVAAAVAEPAADTEPTEVAAAEPVAEPAEPPPPPQVHVTLRAAPAGAQLTLDGAPISNPYQADVPLDHQQHRVVASLDGYRETTRSLGFDRDQSETLALTAVPAPPPVTMATTMATTMASSMTRHVAATRHTSSMSSMRSGGMRASHHGAGFTSANPY